VKQGDDEWLEARRLGVTSTDIPAIIGVSPWKSEGDVAREKQGLTDQADDDPDRARRFRLGHALEDVIRGEDVIEHGIKLRRVHRFIVDPERPLLRTSLDFERVGERTIVEAKSSKSRDWDDGLPQYVEAQVRWQMGVARYPRAHVAALRYGDRLVCFDVEHVESTFEQLVVIAEDFWQRLLAGGPFEESRESVRRAWPLDDGTIANADPETIEAVGSLIQTRASIDALTDYRERLEAAIQTRMGPTTTLLGPGWQVTWKQTKDREEVDYKQLALDVLGRLDPIDIALQTARYTTTRRGPRRFTIKEDKE